MVLRGSGNEKKSTEVISARYGYSREVLITHKKQRSVLRKYPDPVQYSFIFTYHFMFWKKTIKTSI